MIITVDGPAGAGKGTLAARLAQIYSLDFLDTGLLYRAVALKMLESGEDFNDKEAALRAVLLLNSDDLINPSLRNEAIGSGASIIAVFPEVRSALLAFQRNFASNPSPGKQGVILDGRDIGLVILPEAPCKIFVTASPEVRAERRLKELHQKKIYSTFELILEDMEERDTRDRMRKISPLRPAKDAFILDTTGLNLQDVVEKASFFVDSIYPQAHKNQ
ncbi:MAG: (d)CMP kinase [Alphaproteobacteria bacterium]|nr:(d)CMP kinase [Alphaproteobacteria bacterium]